MRSKALTAIVAGALVGSGLLAGSVIGDDGANPIAERLAGDFGEPTVQQATFDSAQAQSIAAGKKKRKKARKPKKPKVIHGYGQAREIAGGADDVVALQCPRKFPVPVSAGLATEIPGIFPGYIGRYFDGPRAMLVAVVNTTESETGQWTPTIVCMKGVKEV